MSHLSGNTTTTTTTSNNNNNNIAQQCLSGNGASPRLDNIGVTQPQGGESGSRPTESAGTGTGTGASTRTSYDTKVVGEPFAVSDHRGNENNNGVASVSRAKSAELSYRRAYDDFYNFINDNTFDRTNRVQCAVYLPNDDTMRVTVPGATANPTDSVNIVTAGGVSVSADNVCNVHVQGEDTDTVVVRQQQTQQHHRPARTFTSTEAQTDDVQGVATATCSTQPAADAGPTQSLISREERRRERRERRLNRRMMIAQAHQQPVAAMALQAPQAQPPVGAAVMAYAPPAFPPPRRNLVPADGEILPDILHSHVPPPYSTLPMGGMPMPMAGLDDMRYGFPVGIRR